MRLFLFVAWFARWTLCLSCFLSACSFIFIAEVSGLTQKDPLRSMFGKSCGEPCIIEYNPGGFLLRFTYLANLVSHGARKRVVIDGICASGCAAFADLARPNVCITPRARFAFHTGWANLYELHIDYEVRFVPFMSPDVFAWIVKHGGLPNSNDWLGMLYMSSKEAAAFWPTCSAKLIAAAETSTRRH